MEKDVVLSDSPVDKPVKIVLRKVESKASSKTYSKGSGRLGPSRKVSYIEGDSNVSKTVKPVLEIPDESSDSLDEGIVAGERLCSFTVGPKVQ